MVSLWGRPWTRRELLARAGRLAQVAGVQRRPALETGALAGTDDIDPFAHRAGLLAGQARDPVR